MIEFSFERMAEFEPSSKGRIFESAEEMQLLHHVIENTPYKTVSSLTHKILNNF